MARRLLRVTAMVAAVTAAYGAGVVTGVVGSQRPRAVVQATAATAGSGHGVIDEAADRIATHAAREVDRAELERAAVEGMLKALGDRWSSYYRPSEYASFQDALDGRYTGVGLWLRPGGGAGMEVGSVQPGSPAAGVGIEAGDRILAVDGQDVSGRSVDDVAALLRGAPQTTVSLVLLARGHRRSLTLTRAAFTTTDVFVERLKGGVTRIKVTAFTRGVGRAVREALTAGSGSARSGVVLDLRGNPGGLLDEGVEVASAFLDGGPVVSYDRRGSSRTTLDAVGEGDTRLPLVVLVDSRTASAAEVVAAALQDRNRAVVVGSRTFGKGSVQEPTTLSDGSAIELTVGRYYTPAGHMIDGVGVTPDVLVSSSAPPEVAERRAIEVLDGLVAALGPAGRG